jgi:hypothetical protein
LESSSKKGEAAEEESGAGVGGRGVEVLEVVELVGGTSAPKVYEQGWRKEDMIQRCVSRS